MDNGTLIAIISVAVTVLFVLGVPIFLVIGFWFTCGLGSRQYQPILGDGQSPIDIMIYFVLAMLYS